MALCNAYFLTCEVCTLLIDVLQSVASEKTLIQNMFSSGDAPPPHPLVQCCVVGGDKFRVRNKRSFPSVAYYSTNFNIELGGARGSLLKICVLRDERFFRSGRNGNQQNCEFALAHTHTRTFARAFTHAYAHILPISLRLELGHCS